MTLPTFGRRHLLSQTPGTHLQVVVHPTCSSLSRLVLEGGGILANHKVLSAVEKCDEETKYWTDLNDLFLNEMSEWRTMKPGKRLIS